MSSHRTARRGSATTRGARSHAQSQSAVKNARCASARSPDAATTCSCSSTAPTSRADANRLPQRCAARPSYARRPHRRRGNAEGFVFSRVRRPNYNEAPTRLEPTLGPPRSTQKGAVMIARLIALAGLAAAAALAGAVVSLAGHESGSVPSYTGCLNASSGTIANLAQADTPTAPCKDKETQIHLSGGDATSILTGLSPGFGLTGGGSGGDVSLAVDPSVIQRRVTGTCAEGGISAISESDAVSCSEQGVAGVLDAGRLDAEGSSDTSLCGTQDGDVEFDASSEPVSL